MIGTSNRKVSGRCSGPPDRGAPQFCASACRGDGIPDEPELYLPEEVEVAAFVGLGHVLQEHASVAAVVFRSGSLEVSEARLQFFLTDAQLDAAVGDIDRKSTRL